MITVPITSAEGLYGMYKALLHDEQQRFLQKLLQKEAARLETLALYEACREAKDDGDFLTDDEKTAFLASLPRSIVGRFEYRGCDRRSYGLDDRVPGLPSSNR